MTLDELIAVIKTEIKTNSMAQEDSYDDGLGSAIAIIEQHRPALEAGMRQPLRFARSCRNENCWFVVGNDGDEVTAIRKFYDQDECIEFAEHIRMTAEFVGDGGEQIQSTQAGGAAGTGGVEPHEHRTQPAPPVDTKVCASCGYEGLHCPYNYCPECGSEEFNTADGEATDVK